MGFELGRDGKIRAIDVNTEGPLYVGLLDALPEGYAVMTLADLAASEFAASDFYDGRKAISFADAAISDDVGRAASQTGTDAVWTNGEATDMTVVGGFVTDAASGTDGEVRFVGPSDPTELIVAPGQSVGWVDNRLVLKVR